MKAITLVKYFTVVGIFLTVLSVQAAAEPTKEECQKKLSAELTRQQAECNSLKKQPTTTTIPGAKGEPSQVVTTENPTTAADIRACKNEVKTALYEQCNDYQTYKEINANCDGKFSAYQAKLDKTNEECAKAIGGNLSSCTSKANQCGAAFNTTSGDSADTGQAIIGLMQMYAGQQAGTGAGGLCTLEDDTLEDRKSQIDDQIQRLEDEKVDSVTKQSELDDELSKKKADVDKEIADLESDFSKSAIARKTKNQQEGERIQKAILASNKKQRDNLVAIADKNTQIANLAFGVQQINIESSDLRQSKVCSDKVMAAKAVALAPVTGADGKKKAPKFTLKESQKLKSSLKLEELTCLQSEALKKQAQLKGIMDTKRKLQSEVDAMMKGNEDEQKAIALEQKSMEELLKIMTEEEAKELQIKNKKLDSLSKSITDMAGIVERKKKALDTKIKNRDAQIANLVLKKQNLKPKFSGVSSSINSSRASAKGYLAACCKGGRSSTVSKDHSGCAQVRSDSGTESGFGSSDSGTDK